MFDPPNSQSNLASFEPVIETSRLVKTFKGGNIRAVDGLNLRIARGEIYALIGANGSGKTTTINLLTGCLFPTSGSIKVLGLNIPDKRRVAASHIGVPPQEYALYSDLTMEQNIWFFARVFGMKRDSFEKRLNVLLPILKLENRTTSD